jgi:hypothetical protein
MNIMVKIIIILSTLSPSAVLTQNRYKEKEPAEVEYMEIRWPGDRILCDCYLKSNGNIVYRVFRFKKSKEIIKVREEGAYCQGDSEYSKQYLFDRKGFAYYSFTGGNIYTPTIVTIYKKGIPLKIIEYASENDSYNKMIKRKIKVPTKKKIVSVNDVEKRVAELRQTIKERILELQKIVQNKSPCKRGPEGTEEAGSTIKSLKKSLRQKGFTGTLYYRKPRINENTMISGEKVRMRNGQSLTSKIIGTVSSYDLDFIVTGIGKVETIDPWGASRWYKVRYKNQYGKNIEGWVFGAFISPGIYPK